MKTVRPTRLVGGEAVHYLWDLPDPVPGDVRGFAETLSAAARSVVALGWGVDLVAGNGRVLPAADADRLPGERWRPTTDPAATGLRVPVDGTLDALDRRHRAFLGRVTDTGFVPVPPLAAFAVVGYRSATDLPGRPFAAFELKKPLHQLAELRPGQSEFRPFDAPRWAVQVAGMVRHAVAEAAWSAGRSEAWINTFVHGHTPDGSDRNRGAGADRRFAYLPLPSIERRGAGQHVGMIRRVLVVGPPGGDRDVAWVRQVLSGREVFAHGGGPAALLSPIPNRDRNVRPYADPAAVWSTVTPVVMPGHDDGNPVKAGRLLRRAFEQAGVPGELIPAGGLEWRPVGFRPGVELARRYRLPEASTPWPTYHVSVRFTQPVRGPLAIGAGRYRGLGLLAAEGT